MPKAYELFAPVAQGMAEELKRRREMGNKRQELIQEEERKLEMAQRVGGLAKETPGLTYKGGEVGYEAPDDNKNDMFKFAQALVSGGTVGDLDEALDISEELYTGGRGKRYETKFIESFNAATDKQKREILKDQRKTQLVNAVKDKLVMPQTKKLPFSSAKKGQPINTQKMMNQALNPASSLPMLWAELLSTVGKRAMSGGQNDGNIQ